MRRHRHRIQWQLTFYLGCVICVLMLIFLLIDRFQQRNRLIESRAAQMTQETQLLRMAIQRETSPDKRHEFLEAYCATMRLHGQAGHTLAVVDPSGRFHATGQQQITREDVLQNTHVRQLLSGGHARGTWVEHLGRTNLLVIAGTYRLPNATQQGIVYYSEPLTDIEHLSDMLFLQRTGLVLLLFAAIVAAVWLFVKYRVAAPLSALLTHEYAASKGDFRLRQYPDPHNEISDVYDMFNIMLKKIERRERFIARGPEESSSLSELVLGMRDDLARVSEDARWLKANRRLCPEWAGADLEDLMAKAGDSNRMASRVLRDLQRMTS